ncbi:MAG: ATP-binding cassette domain-containing protein [Chitinophagaceae bacterium]|nr:ATP-binding cassette domain-containing protein [Chitinophagaceae bacterium]
MHGIFRISKVRCAYGSKSPIVLSIEELEIEQGKLIFLLGASGSGKSTLLETLGLMNNTIQSGELNFIPEDGKIYEYSTLWRNKDNIQISTLRKSYFNFIFQNTNLMENFTAYENVCVAEMIKKSKYQHEVVDGVTVLLNRVGLSEAEVGSDTLAVNLSGGQRQRLAFVRALNSSSRVLLCDEPTGNLDETNANELFEVIREHLKTDLTAIIVSHDIDLAIKHADQIILLTKNENHTFGEILASNIFNRSVWDPFSESETHNFKNRIRNTFTASAEQLVHITTVNSKPKLSTSGNFRRLFFVRESDALSGKHKVNFFLLCSIFLFSFIAIGFGNGSLRYLDSVLNSAFVNWLTISIPYQRANYEGSLKDITAEMNDPFNRANFDYDSVTAYSLSSIYLMGKDEVDSSFVKGRTFDVVRDRKFIEQELLSGKNLIEGSNFRGKQDLAIIVTPKLLERFGYEPLSDHVLITFPISDRDSSENGNKHMPIPIRAIVKELPGKSSFACTEYFYKAYLMGPESPFNPANQTDGLDYFVESRDSVVAFKIHEVIMNMLKENETLNAYSPIQPELPEKNIESLAKGYNLHIGFWSDVSSYKMFDTINNLILETEEMLPYRDIIRRTYFFGYVKDVSKNAQYADMLSVYFKSLDSVKTFADYVVKTYNTPVQIENGNSIEVDMSRVKDKENFNFLSNTVLILSYLIIMFGSVAVSLFIFNLLKMHLNKVKMNIGTFMAIGLGNKESRNIYFSIISLFIVAGIIVAFFLAWGLGYIIDYFLKQNIALEEGVSYFNMFSLNTIFAIAIFLLSSMLVSWFTINRILSKSPGDLIYNR